MMAASLNPDTHPGRVHAFLQLAPEPVTVPEICLATGLDARAATTAAADLVSYGNAARFEGDRRVRFWRVVDYPAMPTPGFPARERIRDRLFASLGVRCQRSSVDRSPLAATA